MKKFYTLAFSLLTAICLNAQPVINADLYINSYGATAVRTLGTYLEQDAGGAGVTWDFSDIGNNGQFNVEVFEPAEVEGSDAFPAATHVFGDGQNFEFTQINETGMSTVAISTGTGNVFEFNPPRPLVQFPVNFNDTYSGTYERYSDLGQGVGNLETGNIDAFVDGYGTLILPSGTYENVLRVRFENTGTLETILNGEVFSSDGFQQTTYWYSDAVTPWGLVSFDEYTFAGQTTQTVIYSAENSLSSSDSEPRVAAMQVFPNPADRQLTAEVSLEHAGAVTASLFSIEGKLVFQRNEARIPAGPTQFQLDLPELPAGVYLLKVENEKETATKRVVISR